MAAFVAATSAFGHSMVAAAVAPFSSTTLEFSSLAVFNARTPQLGVVRFSSASQVWIDSGGSCVKIVARAGGSRPPPGARRPRPSVSRQQPADDDSARDNPINEQIKANTVMLLGEDGKLIGTISTLEALQRARSQELDLVQMDNQNSPCVKIVDYSKYKYEQQKKKREQQKKSVANRMDLKELKMRYNIDTHDYGVRLKSAQRFLKDGDKVKLIVQFKGRELEFKDFAVKLFERFQEDLGEEALVESMLTKDGKNMVMVLAPNKTKVPGQPQTAEKTKEGDQEKAGSVAVGVEA